MPVNPTYPGVYLQELPSRARTIAGLPTSFTAFGGRFARGPANTAIRIFNQGDFERSFGGLDRGRETTFAVAQFFRNGGGEALLVRVAPGGTPANVILQDAANTTGFTATAEQQVWSVSSDNPGLWGNNLRLDVDYFASDPATEFDLGVSEVRLEAGGSLVVRSEAFRNLDVIDSSPAAHDRISGLKHITLSEIAAQSGSRTRWVKPKLDARGIGPIATTSEVRRYYYRRSDLAGVMPL